MNKLYTGSDITILMSVYNNSKAKEVESAVNSVLDEQSIKVKRAIIVLDGSINKELEDTLDELSSRYHNTIQLIRLKNNVGLATALTEGLQYVDTRLVARMDSDDIAVYSRFETQLEMFNNIKNLGIAGGAIDEFTTEGMYSDGVVRKMPLSDKSIRKFAKFRSPFNHPTVMFLKKTVDSVGGYQKFGNLEDYYLWLRILNSTTSNISCNTDKVLVHMRGGENMYSRRGNLKYLKKVIQLKRWMLKNDMISFLEYILGITINGIVIMMPNKLRTIFYHKFLRSKN